MRAVTLPALAAALLALACGERPRPNVVLVSVDTLRADHLSGYGYERPTSPFVDSLAAAGVRFTAAFAHASWTLPSHMSLMTSCHPQTHQVEITRSSLPAAIPTLAEVLAAAGYESTAFVSWIYLKAGFGFGRGFHAYHELLPPPELRDSSTRHSAEGVAGRVIEWARGRPRRPFFLFVHLFDPHMSYEPPLAYARRFDPGLGSVEPGSYERLSRYVDGLHDDAPAIPPAELAQARALYDGEIRYVDAELERLFGVLGEEGLLDDTLVVFTSDHGEELDDHGSMEGHQWTLYDEVLRVPLILVFPDGRFAGAVEPRLAGLIDVAPTVLEALGLAAPPAFEGRSLLPLLAGDSARREEAVFSQIRRFNLKWSLRTPEHKLIYNQAPETDERGMPLAAGFELYDLRADPGERTNVFDPSSPVARELARRLRAFTERRPQGEAGEGPELTPEERRRLESLGYVDVSEARTGKRRNDPAATSSPATPRPG